MDKRRQNGKLIEPSTRAQSSEFDPIILLWSQCFEQEILFMAARFLLQTFFLHIIPLLSFGLIEKL